MVCGWSPVGWYFDLSLKSIGLQKIFLYFTDFLLEVNRKWNLGNRIKNEEGRIKKIGGRKGYFLKKNV